MVVFVGIKVNLIGVVCGCEVSRTKIGLSEKLGVSVRTVERWVAQDDKVDFEVIRKGGWIVLERDVFGNRSAGNVGNLRAGAGAEN